MVERGLITRDQWSVAEVTQQHLGGDLSNILVQKGFIREADLLKFFSDHLELPLARIDAQNLNRNLMRCISYHLVQKYTLIPIEQNGNTITLAISDPLSFSQLKEELSQIPTGEEFRFVIAPRKQIELAIQEFYQVQKMGKTSSSSVEIVQGDNKTQSDAKEKVEEMASSMGTVAAVDSILESAFKDHASDIHLEPQEKFIRVRLRIDGVLEEKHILPIKMLLPIISRIKIISGMNIAEKRAPQDGRFTARIHGTPLECRTSSYPTVYGEKVVIRLLSKGNLKRLEQTGMALKDCECFKSWIFRPHGLILVTGPTGSGKSTSLYAALQLLNSPERNIVSIEDPVESEIAGINQAQVNNKANMTFASALRSMLRQDPDVIMVGEIRDAETAEMAIRAALTGHLVLSTLHTNTAVGAISRLINLGIPPFLLSSSLIGVLGQRLVRKNCSHCTEEILFESEGEDPIGLMKGDKVFKGKGCEHCRQTGYSGRVGIYELLTITQNLRALSEKGATDEVILAQAVSEGFTTMMQDGRTKVLEGMTTADEVVRVTEVH